VGEVYRGYGEGRGGAYLRWDSEGVRNKDMLALPRPAFGIVGREELELVSSIRPKIFQKIDQHDHYLVTMPLAAHRCREQHPFDIHHTAFLAVQLYIRILPAQ